MRKILITLFLLIQTGFVFSQIDTEFWFAPPEVDAAHADRPVYLRMSSYDQAATVTVSIPANPSFTPITTTLNANGFATIDLTSYLNLLENNDPDVVTNKGLFIKSTALISAYYEVLGTGGLGVVNTDIFALKGKNALGTKFYTPFQNYFNNNLTTSYSSFDIVATQDLTVITITPTKDVFGVGGNHLANNSYTITLNKGQTYSGRAIGKSGSDHLSGTLITSNKPIAVTLKDDSLIDPSASVFGWDLIGDQIIPVELTGMEYVVIKASGNLNIDRIFICATEDGTTISVNGNTPSTPIQKGETFVYQLQEDVEFIQTSKPAYVFHVTGFGKEIGGALLPPIGCTGSRQVGFTRQTSEAFALNIVVKKEGTDDFRITDEFGQLIQTLSDADFKTVPGSGGVWKAAQLYFPDQDENTILVGESYFLKNTTEDFHLGILNGGLETGFRYGYFSDYGALELGPDQSICKGDSITLNAGFGMSSYEWNTGANTQFLVVKDPGKYIVKVKKGECILRDTIDSLNVTYNPDPRKVLGKDTSVCSNVEFKITMDTLYTKYKWQDASADSTYSPHLIGTHTYWVEVTNHFGCKTKDSIDVTVFQSPRPKIIYDSDLDKVCWESQIELRVDGIYKNIQWHSGETTNSITSVHLPEYYVTVTDENNCTDSTQLYIDCSPYVKVYNLFTPNGDSKNEVFYIEGLQPDKWILEIYSRWGERLYYHRNYDNSYNGQDLPSGIYFYHLNHVEDKKTFKGWVHIIKDTE